MTEIVKIFFLKVVEYRLFFSESKTFSTFKFSTYGEAKSFLGFHLATEEGTIEEHLSKWTEEAYDESSEFVGWMDSYLPLPTPLYERNPYKSIEEVLWDTTKR